MSCTEIEDITTTNESLLKIDVEHPIAVNKFNKHIKANQDKLDLFVTELISHKFTSLPEIETFYSQLKRKHRLGPSKQDIRTTYQEKFETIKIPRLLKQWMIKSSVRSNSGVLVVTITLSPHKFSCKYDCAYCPQETDLNGKHTQPRSYLSNEPAMLRAIQENFDVRGQFVNRVKSYKHTGNIGTTDTNSKKMEIILSGGTWESYPKDYREQVMLQLYWSANTISNERPQKTLEEEIKENETAEYRIIGLTIETRPDNISPESIRDYCRWGVTRVQIGVQHYDDEILRKLNRKCYTKDTIRAIALLKQCGFKVVVHLMPDLPGSSPELDKWMFDQAIDRQELQFDDVKIYPTAVCKSSDTNLIVSSKIADWYKNGTFTPYSEKNFDTLIDVLTYYKKRINPWVRIQRLVRDIPSTSIEAGYNKMSNFRQILQDKMKKCDEFCHCIRCMEIGHVELDELKPSLVVRKYEASNGIEYHISVETHKFSYQTNLYYFWFMITTCFYWLFTGKWTYWSGNLETYLGLFGFLRLRFDSNPGGDIIPEINNCALIREVHVYGLSLGVGTDSIGSQHRGYGKLLMNTAEQIATMHNYKKSAVIAGVGTREYYKNKCGYHLGETYMLKNLQEYNFNIVLRSTIIVGFLASLLPVYYCFFA